MFFLLQSKKQSQLKCYTMICTERRRDTNASLTHWKQGQTITGPISVKMSTKKKKGRDVKGGICTVKLQFRSALCKDLLVNRGNTIV